MTDVAGSGRFDQVVQRANQAVQDLRQALADKVAEVGPEINAKIDEVQAAIDEIQASRLEGRPQPDNTLPGEEQVAGDPNDPSQSGGTPPPASPQQ